MRWDHTVTYMSLGVCALTANIQHVHVEMWALTSLLCRPHPVKPLTSSQSEKRDGRSVLEKLKSTIHPGRATQPAVAEAERSQVLWHDEKKKTGPEIVMGNSPPLERRRKNMNVCSCCTSQLNARLRLLSTLGRKTLIPLLLSSVTSFFGPDNRFQVLKWCSCRRVCHVALPRNELIWLDSGALQGEMSQTWQSAKV